MRHRKSGRLQWYVAALGALVAVALLAWEYTHGGVVSHHFLDRRDMPTISNWSYWPTYRAEYLFGFVLGMASAFGAVLPMLFALIGVAISATSHLLVRPAFARVIRRALP